VIRGYPDSIFSLAEDKYLRIENLLALFLRTTLKYTRNGAFLETCATWNDKKYCYREFSFSLYKKLTFHFSSAKYEFFCEATTKNHFDY
jgi:hypothetical protein